MKASNDYLNHSPRTLAEVEAARLPQARIWEARGNWESCGWWYRIDHGSPVGPFDSAVQAGRAARAAIIALADK